MAKVLLLNGSPKADGLVVGSPVYYSSPNGTILSFMDRLFYSTSFSKQMKVGAAVVSCRRGKERPRGTADYEESGQEHVLYDQSFYRCKGEIRPSYCGGKCIYEFP